MITNTLSAGDLVFWWQRRKGEFRATKLWGQILDISPCGGFARVEILSPGCVVCVQVYPLKRLKKSAPDKYIQELVEKRLKHLTK